MNNAKDLNWSSGLVKNSSWISIAFTDLTKLIMLRRVYCNFLHKNLHIAILSVRWNWFFQVTHLAFKGDLAFSWPVWLVGCLFFFRYCFIFLGVTSLCKFRISSLYSTLVSTFSFIRGRIKSSGIFFFLNSEFPAGKHILSIGTILFIIGTI